MYNFNLNDALSGNSSRKGSTPIKGVREVVKIYESKDTSTEAFIRGAISHIGDATNCILFVNKSLENLSETLSIVTEVTKKVAETKGRGNESYSNTEIVDVWTMSLESKEGVQKFFKTIWDAILAAVRRVITAIANVVKYVRNVILGAGAKTRDKDYAKYTANKAAIDKIASTKAKVEIATLPWKFKKVEDVKSTITGVSAVLIGFGKTQADKDAASIIDTVDKKVLKAVKTAEEMDKLISSAYGGMDKLKEKVTAATESIKKQLSENCKKIAKKDKVPMASSKALVNTIFFNTTESPKPAKMTVTELKTISGDYKIIDTKFSGSEVTKILNGAKEAQKALTTLTSNLESVAKKFTSLNKDEKSNKLTSINYLVSGLAKERVKFDSFFSGVMLDTVAMVFRFQHAAHRSLQLCLKDFDKETKAAKKAAKSGESYDAFKELDFLSTL